MQSAQLFQRLSGMLSGDRAPGRCRCEIAGAGSQARGCRRGPARAMVAFRGLPLD